jgi:hypothetical protein
MNRLARDGSGQCRRAAYDGRGDPAAPAAAAVAVRDTLRGRMRGAECSVAASFEGQTSSTHGTGLSAQTFACRRAPVYAAARSPDGVAVSSRWLFGERSGNFCAPKDWLAINRHGCQPRDRQRRLGAATTVSEVRTFA